MLDSRPCNPVEPWVLRVTITPWLLRQHAADSDGTRYPLPFGKDVIDGWIVRIDPFDDCKTIGMRPLHFHRITCVIAVHGKGGDEDRTVNANLVHRRDHLITGNVIGPV